MLKILADGSKALQNLDIDFYNHFLQVNVDYLHIYPFHPEEEFVLHAHPNFEFHYISSGRGTVGLVDMESLIKSDDIITIPGLSRSHHTSSVPEYKLKITREHELLKHCHSFPLNEGCVFINPPSHFHWQKSSKSEPIVEYSFRCSFNTIDTVLNDEFGENEEYRQLYNLLYSSSSKIFTDSFGIKNLFESIFKEAYYKAPGYSLRIKNMLLELIICFARHGWNKVDNLYTPPEMDMKKKKLQMIRNYILSNIHRNILIEELAQTHFMSPRTLSRFIKKETDHSVHQFVQEIKIQEALNLIMGTNFKLSEIAEITGFSSAFHLSRIIKKSTGKTPVQFR